MNFLLEFISTSFKLLIKCLIKPNTHIFDTFINFHFPLKNNELSFSIKVIYW